MHNPETQMGDRCFCELAPLYVLDELTTEDCQWMDEQIAACPDLAEELTLFQEAVTALAYSAPVVEPAPDLKERLFQQLDLPLPASEPATESPIAIPGLMAVRSRDLRWRPYRVPGVQVARIRRDLERREVVSLLKAEAGVQYPVHRHATGEDIYMLAGDLVIDGQTFGPGDFLRSQPGSMHAPWTRGGCMFLVRTSIDDEYPEHVTAEPSALV